MCIHSCSKCISQLSYRNKIFGQILRHWTEEQNAKHIHPSERNQILLQRDIVLQVLHFNWVLESWLCDRTNYDQIPLCWMLYPTNLARAHWSWWISASVGAGTTWNGGVRRSTRIKSRPLEYWCGERFIYGRVHDSKWSSKCCHFCLKLHNILLCMLKLSLTFSVCHITWKRNSNTSIRTWIWSHCRSGNSHWSEVCIPKRLKAEGEVICCRGIRWSCCQSCSLLILFDLM